MFGFDSPHFNYSGGSNSLGSSPNPGFSAGYQNAGNAGFWNSVGNMFTGNMDWNRQNLMQNKQNAFNQYMSNTQYQRRVADMIKAGINPAMSFNSAQFQATAPPSATPSPQNSARQSKNTWNKARGTNASRNTAKAGNLKFLLKGLEDLGEIGA